MSREIVLQAILQTYRKMPELDQFLSAKTIFEFSQMDEFKTYDYFLRHLRGLVNGVYNGHIGGEFVDVMANLISGQLLDAYQKAWITDGNELPMPDYLQSAYQDAASAQYAFVDQFYRDIVDARLNNTGVSPLLSRAELWANRYNEAVSEAGRLIALENGGKLKWIYGDADHCETCARLNGLVAYAKEWNTAGFKPQSAPNDMLECGGWKCQCRLEPTDARRSPKVLDTLLNIGVR